MKFSKIAITILVLLPLLSSAQKIKYKDLFPILNSGDHEKGEPMLRTFLATDKKGDEHANGHLQLGLILEKRFYEMDILSDTSAISNAADSAIMMFSKAISLIDEKELKNEEYYMDFHRRDLRTGKFGIKLSDVHLDIEKKIEAVKERNEAIRNFNTHLHRINGRNNLSATIYKQMVEKTDTRRDLLFALTDADLIMLDRIRDNAQGLYSLTNDLKEASKDLGAEYYQSFSNFKFIEQHGEDGLTQTDIFSGTLELWDYETWATALKNDYYGVKEYKNIIGNLESEIQTAQQMIEEGKDPGSISTESLMGDYEKYDSDGPVKPILDLKASRLQVSKLGNANINPLLADSLNVYARLSAANQIIEELGNMTTIYSDVSTPDKIAIASNRYPSILETYYGGSTGFSQFIEDFGAWLSEQKIIWVSRSNALDSLDRWAISETDKIPLFAQGNTENYLTLGVGGDSLKVAFGFELKSKKSFVAWSGSSRGIIDKKTFPAGGIKAENATGKLMPTPFLSYYVYDSTVTENNLLVVATDGVGVVKWSNLVSAIQQPISFRYDETLDQLTIFFFPEDQLPEGDIKAYIVIDRNGTVR